MIYFDIITLFPEAFSYLDVSMLKKAKDRKIIKIRFINPREFTKDKYRQVDDKPYGGGPGMVLKFEPIYKALEFSKKKVKASKRKIILTHPAGKIFSQKIARELAQQNQIIIICGHYEGVDSRIEKFVDLKISIGKYILTGGELPAMVIIDSTVRQLPGVLNHPLSLEEKRFSSSSVFSYPVYTRPEKIKVNNKILRVPRVLLSGNHQLIKQWINKKLKKIL